MEHLGRRLDDYVKEHFDPDVVRVIRREERNGLIRCRMHGSTVARGKVLTYLDSHIEAGVGWLEPLLYRVTDEPKVRLLENSRKNKICFFLKKAQSFLEPKIEK